jgi:single-stranded DNA-binding protein
MMRGINNVILIGSATRADELRHTQNGKPVSSIRRREAQDDRVYLFTPRRSR